MISAPQVLPLEVVRTWLQVRNLMPDLVVLVRTLLQQAGRFVSWVFCRRLWPGLVTSILIFVVVSVRFTVAVKGDFFMTSSFVSLFAASFICWVSGVSAKLRSSIAVSISVNVSGVISVLLGMFRVISCLVKTFEMVISMMLCGLAKVISRCLCTGRPAFTSETSIAVGCMTRTTVVTSIRVC